MHAVPGVALMCEGTPSVQMSWVHELESLGTSVLSATKPQVPESQTAFWQSPAGPWGHSAAVVQLGLTQPEVL